MLFRVRPHPSTRLRGQLLAGLIVPLALGGTLAGCGDDEPAASTPTAAPAATTAQNPTGQSEFAKKLSKNVDQAFLRQMTPHHLMAVEMAKVAVDRAEHKELKTLAKSIVRQQTKEVKELARLAARAGVEPGSGSGHDAMAKDASTLRLTMDQIGMSMDIARLKRVPARKFDALFVDQMVDHHYGAIAMANAEIIHGDLGPAKDLAAKISLAQTAEVSKMVAWKGRW